MTNNTASKSVTPLYGTYISEEKHLRAYVVGL